jgi:hypothetical protein
VGTFMGSPLPIGCLFSALAGYDPLGREVIWANNADSLVYAGRKGSAVRYRKPDMPPDTLSSAEERRQGFTARLHDWRGGTLCRHQLSGSCALARRFPGGSLLLIKPDKPDKSHVIH